MKNLTKFILIYFAWQFLMIATIFPFVYEYGLKLFGFIYWVYSIIWILFVTFLFYKILKSKPLLLNWF